MGGGSGKSHGEEIDSQLMNANIPKRHCHDTLEKPQIIYGNYIQIKSVCKIYIIYEILSTDLYSYVKSVLHTELSTDLNPYIKPTLHTDLHPGYYIQI